MLDANRLDPVDILFDSPCCRSISAWNWCGKKETKTPWLTVVRYVFAITIHAGIDMGLWRAYQNRLALQQNEQIRQRANVPSTGYTRFSPIASGKLGAIDRRALLADPKNDQWSTETANANIGRVLSLFNFAN